tara:strand:- start:2201 stop:3055 length:855 start_codon:yes stop_codon:yes gene_type:complete
MNEFIEKVSVVIVLYKVRYEDSISFQSILAANRGEELLNLFLYDNSPKPQNITNAQGLNIIYHHDPDNSGVSKAYNTGADWAKQLKKSWMLILDQDTALPINIFEAYKNSLQEFPNVKMIAPLLRLDDGRIFSPFKYSFKRGFHLKSITPGEYSLFKIAPVNSGMFLDLDTFFASGGYNNAVKLDFSDFQFIERFRKLSSTFCLMNLECIQDFSDNEASFSNQLNRFKFYCEGALEISKEGITDWLQYVAIVFVRAANLAWRYKNMEFIFVYFNSFLASIFLKK